MLVHYLFWSVFFLEFLVSVSAQLPAILPVNGTCPICFNCANKGCFNFGSCRGGGDCVCSDGFGGPDCSQPSCGSPLESASQRPLRAVNTVCTCDAGFTGHNCNICTNDNICQRMPGKPLGTTYICNNSTKVWSSQHYSMCNLKNRLVEALYPGDTSLTFKRDYDAGTSFATLWYKNDAQFSCNITGCSQALARGEPNWACSTVQCQCNAKTSFCGGGTIDLTNSINKASGSFDLICNNTLSACTLDFEFLSGMFPQGLALQDCQFGECVDETASPTLYDNSPVAISINAFGYAGIALASFILMGVIASLFICKIEQIRRRHMPPELDREGLAVHFKDLSYSIGQTPIISGISGHVEPGTMLGVIGPSGAGKSTFLDILSGRAMKGVVKGTVTIGHDLSQSTFRKLSGFVDQEDVFMPTMTVREVLEFSAALRLPESLTRIERQQRVDEVLEELGLSHIQNSRVGNSMKRGISGGEKRRLSIGVELVTNPAVIYLDEPTSGLDSRSAVQVMSTLAALSHKSKRTVIFSIHQPRSDVFSMFDQILLLSKGSTVFFGRSEDAASFLDSRGLGCPSGYNLADHLIDVASEHSAGLSSSDQGWSSSASVSAVAHHDLRHRLPNDYSDKSTRPLNSKLDDYEHNAVFELSTSAKKTKPKHNQFTASFLTQLSVLLKRSWTNFWRNSGLFIAHNVIAAILGLFLGILYWKSDSSLGGIQNRLGSIFFIQSLLGFSSLTAISAFSTEKLLFIRERSNGYYSAGPLFICKMLFDLIPLRIIPGLILSVIPFYMIGYTSGAENFLRYMAVMMVFAGNCGLFCFALGCAFIEYGTAILVAAILLLFQMLFAGLLVNPLKMSPAISWLQYLSFFKYAYEAVVVNDASGLKFVDQINGVDITIPATIVLGKFGIDINAFWRDFCINVGIFVMLLLLSAICVTRRLRERR
ncbi:hypothetical protein QVD99_007310 [Batrachochytrium dendrobatidis]|nr:hypothetical protein QVD99_007310 [Batrachochytrium dendrobatidis]